MENPNNRLMILCNPHNPIGQIWSREDFAKVARLARQYDVTVFSDEIFAETVYNDHVVQPYSEAPDAWEHAIVSTSLGKAFSLTGSKFCQSDYSEPGTAREIYHSEKCDHYGSIDPLTHAAMLSAYTDEGARWVQAMNGYVLDNIRLVRCFFEKYLPQVHAFENEGAFVLWIDWRSLGLSQSKLHAFWKNRRCFNGLWRRIRPQRRRVHPNESGHAPC